MRLRSSPLARGDVGGRVARRREARMRGPVGKHEYTETLDTRARPRSGVLLHGVWVACTTRCARARPFTAARVVGAFDINPNARATCTRRTSARGRFRTRSALFQRRNSTPSNRAVAHVPRASRSRAKARSATEDARAFSFLSLLRPRPRLRVNRRTCSWRTWWGSRRARRGTFLLRTLNKRVRFAGVHAESADVRRAVQPPRATCVAKTKGLRWADAVIIVEKAMMTEAATGGLPCGASRRARTSRTPNTGCRAGTRTTWSRRSPPRRPCPGRGASAVTPAAAARRRRRNGTQRRSASEARPARRPRRTASRRFAGSSSLR